MIEGPSGVDLARAFTLRKGINRAPLLRERARAPTITHAFNQNDCAMRLLGSLRQFFEEHLSVSEKGLRHLDRRADVSAQHLISHLVEQTVQRAAADAVTHRQQTGGAASWKHCLTVAALVELRSVKMLARNGA